MPRPAATAFLLLAILWGCASGPAPSPSPSITPPPASGRSTCPGAVAVVETNLTGGPADALERLGATYQGDPGYLAVVFDGRNAVVIVESDMLPAWQARLAPGGIAVARSCVQPGLVRAVEQAMSRVVVPKGMIVSSGYDGLADAVRVSGVDQDTLVAAIGQGSEAAREAAIQAIADGTLRVNPQAMPNTLSP